MSANDYFHKVGRSTATTLASPGYTTGDTTINVGSTTNWPADTGVTFAIDEVDGDGLRVAGTYNVFRGDVAGGTQIDEVVYVGGDANRNYSAGVNTRVYILVSSYRDNRFTDGILEEHNQDGTHSAITATSLVASGNSTAASHISTGDSQLRSISLETVHNHLAPSNFVQSGCIWTADAAGSTRLASMSAGVVYINGRRYTISAVANRTFTASKDTYVDIDNTGTVIYTEVNNNVASPVLAANSIRIATVVTAAGSIAASTAIGQGGFANITPVISSQIFKGFDSLGNIVYPKGPATPAGITNPVKFSVYRAAAWTSSGSSTVIPFDTKTFDTGNNVDVVTNKGRFTVPVSGYYWFSANATHTTATSTIMYSTLRVNGTDRIIGEVKNPTIANNSTPITGMLQLTAGDYVEATTLGGGGSTMTVGDLSNNFSGFLISAS